MKTVSLPDGTAVPQLGFGTWRMGEVASEASREIAAVGRALDLGMTLIDTAEMYGEGGAEEIVGKALAGRRDEAFIVSKVYPHNATRQGVIDACERSLWRLGTDRIDLYLLHWPGSTPIAETISGFQQLVADGMILRWGVSNFDTADMKEMWQAPGGSACATNQILYNITRRGPEYDLLPWMKGRSLPAMAYSPLEQGRRVGHLELDPVAQRHGVTAAQIMLAWVLRRDDLIAIPKASHPEHITANHDAARLELDEDDLAALDRAFPLPSSKQPLGIL